MSETFTSVLRAARLLFAPGDLIEVRVPKAGREKTISGYFSDWEKLAQAVAALENRRFPGVYWTLNPVLPALLARSDHKAKPYAEATTSDTDIVRRRWLLIDTDPKRPSGISASDAEKALGIDLALRIRDYLRSEIWPDPILADSGNGGHLLYLIDLPNDPLNEDLVKRTLHALAARFDTAQVEIDKTVFNASRIAKIYGTTARKGDDTQERPHRLSKLLEVPERLEVVSHDQLRVLASQAPQKSFPQRSSGGWQRSGGQFDLEGFLSKYGIAHRPPVAHEGGRKFVLEACPFDSSHKAPDAAVFERPDGSLAFKCFHNSCADRGWKDVRDLFEPNRPTRPYVVPPPGRDSAARAPEQAPADTPPSADDGRDKILPLSAADVEAAIDVAIAADDLEQAMRLIPEIATVPLASYTLIVGKLRKQFKRNFPSRDFARAVKELHDKQNAAPPPDDGEEPPADAPDLTGYPLTDSGNGERLIALFGDDIRFCPEFKKWLQWDGRRWRVDTDAVTVTQKVKNMARLLHKQAAKQSDPVMRKVLQDHARDSESQSAISAALLRAKSEPGMVLLAVELDQHRYLLNCRNGVVDVRTGELLPHERRYYITKLVHTDYRPDSEPEKDCPRFMKFLNWSMGETPDMGEIPERITRMVGFLQKSIGYALTGDVSEKAAFIFYGAKGNNGKTTLLTIFKTLLSEYSAQLDINTLMTTKFTDNNVRADLAKLHGARFVITSEVDDGQRLSERLMKYLTSGMGEMVACRKFENPFEFKATHKIFMDCNYRPEVKGADDAIWYRLHCIPFLQRIQEGDPELDKQLIDKINAEAQGVLAWAVRGATRWYSEKSLGVPPEVKDANAEWRAADDPLKEFLEECCEVSPEYWVRCVDLSAAYGQWCKDNHEKFVLNRSRLAQRLELKGFKLNRSRRVSNSGKQARCWDGIKLRADVTLAQPVEQGFDPDV